MKKTFLITNLLLFLTLKLFAQFQQEALPYHLAALEPYIDKETMEIHYSKHHAGYVKNLNNALGNANLQDITSLRDIFNQISQFNTTIRNNAGGHYNHTFFWNILSPNKDMPLPLLLADAIKKEFGSVDEFKKQFIKEGMKIFGSGWLWLIVTKDNTLMITTTANQDNPLMSDIVNPGTPILAIDSWEHAYYLKYQNNRMEYLEAIWHVINWERVNFLYEQATK